MSPQIKNPKNLNLPPEVEQVLKVMFAAYRQVVIRKEFGSSLSGGRVIEVRSIRSDGTPELPTVVKLAAISLIQKEWQAYRRHIRRRLPNIAEVTGEPILRPQIGWGGLRYPLMGGGGAFEVVSLRDYCGRAEATVDDLQAVLSRLLEIMQQMWGYHHTSPEFHLQASYDRLLPVNLLLKYPPSSPGGQPELVTPDALPARPLEPGLRVRLAGFAIAKVDLVNQTVTLNRPEAYTPYYVRLKSELVETMAAYQVGQIIEPLEGDVIETRASRLQDEVRRVLGQSFDPTGQTVPLPDGTNLTNPLTALSTILNETRDLKVASIHGDFNLENILIEPETGAVSLIDFAEARQDHILHDFLRLETEVMTKLIPEILHRYGLPPLPTLASFCRQLHWTAFQAAPVRLALPHPDLEKPLAMLAAIRQAARSYFFDFQDYTEYYQGLILYLLGALKFRNLNRAPEHPLPKQAAFWGAALAYQFLTAPPDAPDTFHLVETQPESGRRPQSPPIDISTPAVPPEKSDPTVAGRSGITVGHISGGYVAIGPGAQVTVSQSVVSNEITWLFETLYQRIEIRIADPDVEKEELIEIVGKIQQELVRGEQANPKKIERWLNNLAQIAPDISKAAVAGLIQPDAGVPPLIRQIAAKAGSR